MTKKIDERIKANKFGMVLVQQNKKMPVESLKFNEQYQRATEPARKEKVKNGIITCGLFLPDQSITINEKNEVVDGQHRLLAAIELGLEYIPVAKYSFPSVEQEAAFFVYINGFDQRLNQVDYWYGCYLAGDLLAETMYRLDSDPASSLKDKLVIKGRKTSDTKLSPSMVLETIAVGLDLKGSNWQRKDHHKWIDRLESIGWRSLLSEVNAFVCWYETIFGTKQAASWSWHRDSFRAIKMLYFMLKENGWHDSKETIRKMKTFSVDATYVAAPLTGKKHLLVGHYNKGKQTKTLDYSIMDRFGKE